MQEKLPSIKHLIKDILPDEQAHLDKEMLSFLAFVTPEDLQLLREVWPKIPLERRRTIMEAADLIAENEPLSFVDLAEVALEDPDPRVRFYAISTIWEDTEDRLAKRLIEMASSDSDVEVRAQAAAALGQYMISYALGHIGDTLGKQIEATLFRILEDEDEPAMVRRSALSSLGSSTQYERVGRFIRDALKSEDEKWIASALAAIANSTDESWAEMVLPFLDHPNPEVRFQAARAAGRILLEDAIDKLVYLLDDVDPNVRAMAAWSLSEFGGHSKAFIALEKALARAHDPEEKQGIREALNNYLFNTGPQFVMMEYTPEELDDRMYELTEEEYKRLIEEEEAEFRALEDLLDHEHGESKEE